MAVDVQLHPSWPQHQIASLPSREWAGVIQWRWPIHIHTSRLSCTTPDTSRAWRATLSNANHSILHRDTSSASSLIRSVQQETGVLVLKSHMQAAFVHVRHYLSVQQSPLRIMFRLSGFMQSRTCILSVYFFQVFTLKLCKNLCVLYDLPPPKQKDFTDKQCEVQYDVGSL
jgi:hypothetical protein